METISTAVNGSAGWKPADIQDFFDIKLHVSIYIERIIIVNGSNVDKYSLTLVDEDGDSIKKRKIDDIEFIVTHSKKIKVIRFQQIRRQIPNKPYNIKLEIFGCASNLLFYLII